MPTTVLRAPPIFRPCDGPGMYLILKSLQFSRCKHLWSQFSISLSSIHFDFPDELVISLLFFTRFFKNHLTSFFFILFSCLHDFLLLSASCWFKSRNLLKTEATVWLAQKARWLSNWVESILPIFDLLEKVAVYLLKSPTWVEILDFLIENISK